ncbi:Ppx/GppA family phosphatase [Psychromarinibacter sp. C21-152]|uniref:Ppx/GppA family phosphatase n=1 Tax=Psychromarinibacter sediminicola TaxID=3033385 RepID=A0AAE3NQC9_9RHOB|nr:Ppx/GppA family phosphatase [Psychromarinibacter sediminicola]MDF0600161.1 Ppx/GppA family phosphatase [Psychromarinibacter sediminicola]
MDGTPETHGDDWDPFGRPLFDDPAAEWLKRVGVVDVGSNSVRLVIFDGAARSPAYFYNEKIMAGLGAGFAETGRLNPEGRKRALAALKRFQLLAEDFRMAPLTAVATAAVRNAEDGPEFCEEVLRETGLKLWVIDGEEEARLSAQGVLLGWPQATGIVCDIGGSSMELASVADGQIGTCLTSPLGPLQLQGFKSKKARRAHIRETIGAMWDRIGPHEERLYLVGGSWRAIARHDMVRRDYPLRVLHEYRMTRKDVGETLKWIAANDPSDLAARTGTSSTRMALVPLASEVLKELVSILKPREIAISSYGIREGMLYQQMPEQLRRRDPLIEACRFAETKDARRPGFGRALYRFVKPLFAEMPPARQRVVKAACLLHDVSWRAHPDYRHEACFDYVTRASLGGLTHGQRIFLGVALLHRYKNSRTGIHFQHLFDVLTEAELHQAEVLGKAMRFGSMLTADLEQGIGQLGWSPRKKRLELNLSDRARDLYGEVAEARFRSLAATLGAETKVS